MFLVPHDLEDRITFRRETVAGCLIPFFIIDPVEERFSFATGPAIGPDRGGSLQQATVFAEWDDAQAVSGDGKGGYFIFIDLSLIQQVPGGTDDSLPPVFGCLFLPARLRVGSRIGDKDGM